MTYLNKHRNTKWRLVRRNVKPCGMITYKMKAVDGGFIVIISQRMFEDTMKEIG